jgi:protein SCO1
MSKNTVPLIIAFSVVLILGSLYGIYILDPGAKPEPKPNVQTGEAQIGGEFSLHDSKGVVFTDENLKGKYSLVYFGFVNCPDICPTVLTVIAGALDALSEEERGQTQAIFVSVDPSRDTDEQLEAFVKQFHPEMIGLTGTEEEVEKTAEAFKVYYNKVEQGNFTGDNYLVDHTSITYLMDKDGKYIAHFSAKSSVEEIADKLKAVISK